MPTIVDNLTFINMINTTSGNLKASIVFIFQHFSFYEQLKFDAHLGWAWKKLYNVGAWLLLIVSGIRWSHFQNYSLHATD